MKNYFIIALLIFSTFFTQAQIVNIPDANFKEALVNSYCADIDGDGTFESDADTNNDGEIQESEALALIGLRVNSHSISSLEGIHHFANLINIRCESNYLTNLDISENQSLEKLNCSFNQLSSIDISQNQNLKELKCNGNEYINLDISQNPNIELLSFRSCQLTSIDLSQNPNLIYVSGTYNLFTNIDVSQNPNLEELYFSYNQLTSLDVSQNPNLRWLGFIDNDLTSMNIKNGNNENIISLNAYYNFNLTCIQVDDENYASAQYCGNAISWCVDNWVEFSEDCQLGSEDFNQISISLYPNPVQNILNITSELSIEYIKIYTSQGQLVNETTNSQIDVSLLSSGLYFVSLMINKKIIVKKFIKE